MRSIDASRLPADLATLVEPLPHDPWVERFRSDDRGHGVLLGALHGALRRVVSDFDADGLLGTHPMALFGPASWRALVERRRRLLDVGAGSGAVTEHARELVDVIETTETSKAMARRLRARGWTCHPVDLAFEVPPSLGTFDAVSLLNVLDRSERPRTLLRAALGRLEPDGVCILSVPLPARPHFDLGRRTVEPDELLGGRGPDFEAALVDLVKETLEPCGLRVTRLARAPYLSRGLRGALHELDVAVVVGRPEPGRPEPGRPESGT